MARRKPSDYGTGIPRHELKLFALTLLPDIQAYFESEEGKREFAEWKEKQAEQQKPQGA